MSAKVIAAASIREATTTARRAALLAALATVGLLAALALALALSRGPVAGRPGSPARAAADPAALARSIGATDPAYRVRRAGAGTLAASSPAARMQMRFGADGTRVRSGHLDLALRLSSISYGGAAEAITRVAPRAAGDRALYGHGDVGEWYANTPLGLEQGFTLSRAAERPAGVVTLRVALGGGARAAGSGDALTLSGGGATLLYTGLEASDASGRPLHAWLGVTAGGFAIHVDARGARFPLRIDPFLEQAQLTPSETSAQGRLGEAVALSADGDTAIVGAPGDGSGGAAWVFTRVNGTWTQDAKLTGGEESGEGRFGAAVALSADGDTALVGGWQDGGSRGAAWVFTRSAEGWVQQGPKLTPPEEGRTYFGTALALSADGDTALIGAPEGDGGEGAAFVFTRAGGGEWSRQHELTGVPVRGNGGEFGAAVALSGSGDTALVGEPYGHGSEGVAYVFSRSGSEWSLQEELEGDEQEEGEFGYSVALSANGETALVGEPEMSEERGEESHAFVFVRRSSRWRVEEEIYGPSSEHEGSGVALDGDGDVALVATGADASEWTVYRPSEEEWRPHGALPRPAGASSSYNAVALSAEGDTAISAVPTQGGGVAWALWLAPQVTTHAAESVAARGADLEGSVNPEGREITACSFEYGTSESLGTSAPCASGPGSGTATVPVSASLTGLKPETTYYYRLSAGTADGTRQGAIDSFKTTVEAPIVSAVEASLVGQTSAKLSAAVDPNGGTISECRFEYGTSEGYGSSVPCEPSPGSGEAPTTVSAEVKGLKASTAYHFHVVAVNGAGAGADGDHTFTTATPVLPEFGYCNGSYSVGEQLYTDESCVKPGETGRYQYGWHPWYADGLTVRGTVTKLELQGAGSGKPLFACASGTIAGEYTGEQSVALKIRLLSCSSPAQGEAQCGSAGAAGGEVSTTLEGRLGVIANGSKPKVGIELTGAPGPDWASFTCGGTQVALRGGVIASVATIDKDERTFELKLKGSKGVQTPEAFEGSAADPLVVDRQGGAEERVSMKAGAELPPWNPIEGAEGEIRALP